MSAKRIYWVGAALDEVRALPEQARCEAGHQLHAVQFGRMPSDWKPMRTVGPGVMELRLHLINEYRVLFVARHAEAIYVLHAFAKKSRRTSQADVDVGRRRFREMMQLRRIIPHASE